MKFSAWGLFFTMVLVPGLYAQTAPETPGPSRIPGGHRGAVTALVYDGKDRVLSAGTDGFIGIWDIRNRTALERYQMSPYSINAMALRPGKTQIALVESDGLGIYRVSAWDYQAKRNLFTLRFKDPLLYLNYSAGGNFIIAARNADTAVVFIHPETGEILRSPGSLSGAAEFAATGLSERTMVVYLSSGVLSYWELESGEEIRHFKVPANMSSPILFGNNRFFGGIDSQGLVVLNAVTGDLITRDSSVRRGKLWPVSPELAEFKCAGPENGPPEIYHFSLNPFGVLELKDRISFSPARQPITGAVSAAANGAAPAAVLGTARGDLFILGEGETPMTAAARVQIREAAAAGNSLALLTERGSLGLIPLDYRDLRDGGVLELENAAPYTRLSAEADHPGRFILWQSGQVRPFPVVRTISGGTEAVLEGLSPRHPLRSVSALAGRVLFLDTSGGLGVVSIDTGGPVFSVTLQGALDGVFQDRENIIVGMSGAESPFLTINTGTGETAPIPYPLSIGARLYRGTGIYGAAVDPEAGKTTLVRISGGPVPLVEYPGEDTGFSAAECGGVLASTLGGDRAILYDGRAFTPFERSPGLPLRLIDGGTRFIALDGDGNIAWHDPRSGELLALFTLYEQEWRLDEKNGPSLGGALSY
jgi:hypothetical protein